MKLDLKALSDKIQPALLFIKRYVVFVFAMAMLVIFGFFVLRINQLSRLEPTDDAVTEKLQTVQRPKIDPAVLTKIEQLQDQNIQVQSLFDQARSNPFTE